MRMTEWRPIQGYEKYEISNSGDVRKVSTKRPVKPELGTVGYMTIKLGYGVAAKRRHFNIHRLVAETFIPNPMGLACVNHKDGNKLNNDVSNLEWCTYSHNNAHAYRIGLKTPPQQVISKEDRYRVGVLRRSGMRVKDIAKIYHVTPGCIYQLYQRDQIPAEVR